MTLFSHAQNTIALQPNNETTINSLKRNGTHKSKYIRLLEVETSTDTSFLSPINVRTCKLNPTDLNQ